MATEVAAGSGVCSLCAIQWALLVFFTGDGLKQAKRMPFWRRCRIHKDATTEVSAQVTMRAGTRGHVVAEALATRLGSVVFAASSASCQLRGFGSICLE